MFKLTIQKIKIIQSALMLWISEDMYKDDSDEVEVAEDMLRYFEQQLSNIKTQIIGKF